MKGAKTKLTVLVLAVASIVALIIHRQPADSGPADGGTVAVPSPADPEVADPAREEEEAAMPATEEQEPSVPMTEAEKTVAEAEEKVEAFDALIDKWSDPAKTGIEPKAVESFIQAFKGLPKERRTECVNRAINLIPDENAMLLAGILMDRSMDVETVETVFADILNRDESVKMPILKEIYKDKHHPCWDDASWVLEVAGEK